ncbi:MAG: acetyl-CoA carboxylase biotin carboxylase subunit [Mobilitalea sp.]
MFNKILIANRGEIAVRIIRTCREMGIRTVAVCSEVDKEALHSQLADETICIGPNKAKDSYLNMESILSAAIATNAQAIHPGFGFLSENSKFVKMCNNCGITFIGPNAESIENMGNKSEARKMMIAAGVPVVPGTVEPVENGAAAEQFANEIGYPVIIKAVHGGGGKGMRIVHNPQDFQSMFETARKEAMNGFGNDEMYVEKYVAHARHVEFQILADKFGNVIHLGERDCSLQRRHQKMIEETPCTAIDAKLREEMGKAAVMAAKSTGYHSAGTIEFILDPKGNYYFIEMNTRIQVEHPVTEMVTGIDIVKEMIKIASGEKLSYQQKDIVVRGHSIECRINAEDPDFAFRPCPGTVTEMHFPGGNGIRIDSALYRGYEIPSNYDSMIAKLIVHGKNREEAVYKMRSALGEMVIQGIKTNIDFQYTLMNEDDFMQGRFEVINQLLTERCE